MRQPGAACRRGAERLTSRRRRLAAGSRRPLLYPAIKQVLQRTEMVTEHEGFRVYDSCAAVEAVNRSDDLLEGARAFTEKRDPVWKGR